GIDRVLAGLVEEVDLGEAPGDVGVLQVRVEGLLAELEPAIRLPQMGEAEGVGREARSRHALAAGLEAVDVFVEKLLRARPLLPLDGLAAPLEQVPLRFVVKLPKPR